MPPLLVLASNEVRVHRRVYAESPPPVPLAWRVGRIFILLLLIAALESDTRVVVLYLLVGATRLALRPDAELGPVHLLCPDERPLVKLLRACALGAILLLGLAAAAARRRALPLVGQQRSLPARIGIYLLLLRRGRPVVHLVHHVQSWRLTPPVMPARVAAATVVVAPSLPDGRADLALFGLAD